MKYKAIPPIKKNYCTGCIFLKPNYYCARDSSVLFPCCSGGTHNNIYIILKLTLNDNLKIL